jgi:hypothetical protein
MAVAQSVWTVGSSGANFTNLPQAVAAAQDGDLIMVQPGSYNVGTGIVTSKALRILGGPGRQLIGPSANPTLRIAGLAAGNSFVLDGFELVRSNAATLVPGVDLNGNAGFVHLANLLVRGNCPSSGFSCDLYGIIISACAHVTMTRCRVLDTQVQCYGGSQLTMSECDLSGLRGLWLSSYLNAGSTPAFVVGTAQVWVTQSSFVGGGGDVIQPSAPGIYCYGNARVTLAGDGSVSVTAGAPGATQAQPTSAIQSGGTALLEYDPAIPLVPNPGAPSVTFQYSQGAAVVQGHPVALHTTDGVLGSSVGCAVRSLAGEVVLLAGGPIAAQVTATPFGPAWLDLGQVAVLAIAVQGPGELYTTAIQVPNLAAFRGMVLGFQAVAGGASMATRLSGLSTIMLH